MALYLFRRILLTAPTLLIVCGIVFLLLRVIPGDPAAMALADVSGGADGSGSSGQIARLREELGLDDPLPLQFMDWLGDLARGDLGVSIMTEQPVAAVLAERLAVSLKLAFASVLLAAAIGVPLGVFAASRQGSLADFSIVLTAIFLLSIPGFWIGLMLLMFFGSYLGWLPVIGISTGALSLAGEASRLVLPVIALALGEIAVVARMMRTSTVEVLRLEYITHARAKGLPSGAILRRHAFRNAFAPTLTVIGLKLGEILGGVAVIETVFTLPGVGRLLIESIYARDYPVIQGCILTIALIYIAINLLVDLVYPLLNPQVRY